MEGPAEVAPDRPLLRRAAEDILGAKEVAETLARGHWIEPWPGVLLPTGQARDPASRAMAALLWAGPDAVLSGLAAAAVHGCIAGGLAILEVTVPYDSRARSVPGLRVRQRWIREADVIELDGLRVHALDVALSELLCTESPRLALSCVEQALSQLSDADAEHLHCVVAERINRRVDRRGTRQANALLEMAWTEPPAPEQAVPQARPDVSTRWKTASASSLLASTSWSGVH